MYCPRSLKWLGSVLATALTEPFFGEQLLPYPDRRRHTRTLVLCDSGDALWETIGETVMLVCPSSSARMSALTCLLAQSLDWVARCSRSHLCSGSDIWKERVSSTELRPVPSTGLHKLSPGSETYARHIRELRRCLPGLHVGHHCDVPRARAVK